MNYEFQTLTGKKYPKRETFMDAWNDMYEYVKASLDAGTMSYQELETALWIVTSREGLNVPILFYDARDMAIDNGWTQPI